MIPYGKHFLDQDDIDAVVETLKSGALTQGPAVAKLESEIAQYTGAKHAVAVSSGTAALHLACMALELTTGDQVLTSANTFVASANCTLYVGASPQFVDISDSSLNLDINILAEQANNSSNLKAIIPVHFAGLPCDMPAIHAIAKKHNAGVIEDASHALGSNYENGEKVGNCQFSDLTLFSLHPVKGVAAGEGGIITTNNKALHQKLLMLRSHGIYKGNFEFPGGSVADDNLINKQEAIEGTALKSWYYEMQMLGYNYRITDFQCALASSQLQKIEQFISRRKELVARYNQAFAQCDNIQITQQSGLEQSSHHLYVVRIDFSKLSLTRNQLMQKLREQGIGSQVHYIPVPMQPYYQQLGFAITDYPATDKYYQEALTLPLYYGLTNEEQEFVIKNLIELLNCKHPVNHRGSGGKKYDTFSLL